MISELQPEHQPEQGGEERARKILYITTNLPYGPGEAFLISEIKELRRRGCDVRIVPRSPTGRVVHDDAAEIQECCTARSIFCWDVVKGALKEIFLRPRGALGALAVLFRSRDGRTLAKNLAVYAKGLWLGGMARAWQADHIHVHWISTPATMGMVASMVSQTPWSCTAHRADIDLNNLLAEKLRLASFVRFISQSGWRMAVSLGAPPDPHRAVVLHLGVNLPSETDIPSSCGPRSTILCPANLYPVKGHRYLIEAIGLLQRRGVECKLLVAGSGELRPELEAQVERLGLAATRSTGCPVQFLGQRSHSEILAMYRDGRVGMVVLPSVDLGNNLHEGIPVALIEAMSYSIPVVGTQTGGIPELLEGGAGLMVPEKDPAALADAIERYVRDPVFAAEVAGQGRQRIFASFNVATVVSQLLERMFPPQGAAEIWSSAFRRPAGAPPSAGPTPREGKGEGEGPPKGGTPAVTVIIPCRNEGKWIGPCLDSVLANDYPKEMLEVLVIDGMSTDETRSVVECYAARHACIRLLDNAKQITPAALNIGIAAARGAVILRMDAHVDYPVDYVATLVRLLQDKGADNVGGVCLTQPGGETAMARAIAVGMSHPLGVGNSHFRIGSREQRWVDTVPFGCYRREVFERIGLFDEDLVRNQDDELNLRLIRHGGRILLSPQVVCRYYARDSLAKLWRMYYQYGYFKPLVVRKVGGVMTLRQLAPPLLVLCLAATALAGLLGLAILPIGWKLVAPTAFALVAGSYLLAIGTCAVRAARKCGWAVAAALVAVFPALHLSYGIGYLRGVVEFLVLRRNRAGSAGAIPVTR